MSCYINIKSWSGPDVPAAAARLAKLFKMPADRANDIVENLSNGISWQFEEAISDGQGRQAAQFLTGLGFDVAAHPIGTPAPAAPTAEHSESPAVASAKGSTVLGFYGKGGELFGIFIVNLALTVVTLGVYRFWAKTKVRNYLWSHVSFLGSRFGYHGTGKELMIGFMKFSLIIFGVAAVVGILQVTAPVIGQGVGAVLSVAIGIAVPAFMVGAWRYRLSRTSLRGIRFSFRGLRKSAVWLFFKGGLLSFFTLGLYTPFFDMQRQKFWRNNSWFGNQTFEFSGEGRDIFKQFLLALVLTIPTLGINWFWYLASVQRYSWSHTRLMGAGFQFTASGKQLCFLQMGNLLLIALTLGIAFPWVTVRNMNFMSRHLSYEGGDRFDKALQDMQESGAIGEEALDAFDIPIDVG